MMHYDLLSPLLHEGGNRHSQYLKHQSNSQMHCNGGPPSLMMIKMIVTTITDDDQHWCCSCTVTQSVDAAGASFTNVPQIAQNSTLQ